MSEDNKKLTTTAGCPVAHSQNVTTAVPRGPQLRQDVWYLEKLAHFDREVIPERRLRHLCRDQRHHEIHSGEGVLADRQEDPTLRPLHHRRGRARRGGSGA